MELPVAVSKMLEDCAALSLTILPINGIYLDKLNTLLYIQKVLFDMSASG